MSKTWYEELFGESPDVALLPALRIEPGTTVLVQITKNHGVVQFADGRKALLLEVKHQGRNYRFYVRNKALAKQLYKIEAEKGTLEKLTLRIKRIPLDENRTTYEVEVVE
ncbi:MAG: hypothetical protein ACXQS5_06755 [Candidatus Methanospirareceae archaeon]